MLEYLHLSWKSVGIIAAMFCLLSFFRRKSPDKPSLGGRVGGHLITHVILSTITGVLGFNVVIAVGSVALAIPLMLIGAKVELPDTVKDVPRGIVSRVKETFIDKKEAVAEKLHEKKEELADKFHGRKEAVEERDPLEEPMDPKSSDEAVAARIAAMREKAKKKIEDDVAYRMGQATRRALFFWEW